MRWVNLFFLLLFLISAALQYNDPDPYLWIPIYLFGAYLSWEGFKFRYKPVLYYCGYLILISYAIWLFFTDSGVWYWIKDRHTESLVRSMKADSPWIEQSREFGGLLLILIMMVMNQIWLRRKAKTNS